jgi:predicted alpha/beta hydrolase family esterase
VILLHGYKSGPGMHFFPWLADALKAQGFEVVVPELPNAEEPDRDLWTKAAVDSVNVLTDKDIVVGHSLGGATALRFLEAAEARTTPHACVLISTPWMIKDDKFRSFFLTELDYEVLMWRASKFAIIHAKDDPVIPLDHAERYAEVFHARLITPETGGHFQKEAEYPVILETILELAREPVEYAPGMSLDDQFADLIK